MKQRSTIGSRVPRRMGFYYRKSVKLGPFRVNLSSRGVGDSFFGGAFASGLQSRRYSNFTMPGTRMGYRAPGAGCLLLLRAKVLAPGARPHNSYAKAAINLLRSISSDIHRRWSSS